MKRIYLNTWNSMGSIVVNSVLGLAYWGGLGVAKLALSVSQMDCSCLSERRVWRIFFGVLSWDFHTCTFMYTPCWTFLPCLSFFYTLLWNFCMLSCTIRVWHVLFECHPPWKLDSFGIMNLCYSLGCKLEGNCRVRCLFSDWFDALSWHFCTFVCDSFIIYYQIFVEHELFLAICIVVNFFFLMCILWRNLVSAFAFLSWRIIACLVWRYMMVSWSFFGSLVASYLSC